jgi:hypothetical protein
MRAFEVLRSAATVLSVLAKFALGMVIIFGVPRLARLVRLPAVVGLLLSGVVIGPHVLGIFGEQRPIGTSGSTGTEISGRDLISKRSLHRLIDFAASELESYQKGCRKQQGWEPAKSRAFLQRFGRSQRISFLIDRLANVLHLGQLVGPDSAPLVRYR